MSKALGISLPSSFASGPVEGNELVALAQQAEEAGFSTISCGDHLLWHSVILDPLVTLGALAQATQRISLMTSVLLAPLRNEMWLAKQVSTLQYLSGGRLVLGMGIGGELPAEFKAARVDYNRRGEAMDKVLDLLATLQRSQRGNGTRVEVDDGSWCLGPDHEAPPIWLGGRSTAALRRVVRKADGLLGIFQSPNGVASMRAELHALAEKEGRDPTSIRTGIQLFVCYDEDATRADERSAKFVAGHFGGQDVRLDRHIIRGNVRALREGIEPYLTSDCDFVQTHIVGDRPRETLAAIRDSIGDWLPGEPMSRRSALCSNETVEQRIGQ